MIESEVSAFGWLFPVLAVVVWIAVPVYAAIARAFAKVR